MVGAELLGGPWDGKKLVINNDDCEEIILEGYSAPRGNEVNYKTYHECRKRYLYCKRSVANVSAYLFDYIKEVNFEYIIEYGKGPYLERNLYESHRG